MSKTEITEQQQYWLNHVLAADAFNGRFRKGCLNQHWFETLNQRRHIINKLRKHDNEVRPHTSLNFQSPAVFARQVA